MFRNSKATTEYILKIVSFITVWVWGAMGIITILSPLVSPYSIAINIIMGLIFVSFAYFVNIKYKYFSALLTKVTKKLTLSEQRNVILPELILYSAMLLLGLIMLSGVLHRVFSEGYAVFG